MPKLGSTFELSGTTNGPAGIVDADTTPTCEVFEDGGNDTAIFSPTMVKRTGKTGVYRTSIVATVGNSFAASRSYSPIMTYVIGGITYKVPLPTFILTTRNIDDASTYAGDDTAGTGTLLSRLTSTRAGYMDNLANTPPTAAEIKTAIEASGSSLDTLLARLTATRAGYLDKLNITGNVAAQGDVLNVSNNTRLRGTIPQVLERPDSGSSAVPLVIELYDEAGNMEAPDSTPTVALAAQDGTDLAARVGSLSNPSSGRYTFDYTNAAAHGLEVLRWTISVIEGGVTRTYSYLTQLVDTSSVDFTSADRSTLADIVNYVDALETRLTNVRAALLDNLQYLTAAPATADALADVPTVAEFEARTLAAASYATQAKQDTAQTSLNAISTKTQLDAQIAAILAAIEEIEVGGGALTEEQADQLESAYLKTLTLGAARVTVASNVAQNGDVAVQRGCDYLEAIHTAIEFVITGPVVEANKADFDDIKYQVGGDLENPLIDKTPRFEDLGDDLGIKVFVELAAAEIAEIPGESQPHRFVGVVGDYSLALAEGQLTLD